MSNAKTAWAGLLAILAVSVTACTPTQHGQAQPPTDSPSSANHAPSADPSTDTTGAEDQLARTDPCSLLSADELHEYGSFRDSNPAEIGEARACEFVRDRSGSQIESLAFVTGIRETTGVSEAIDQGMGIRNTETNGRKLAQIPDSLGCTIAIGVTDSSRVDVVVNTTLTTEQACEIADELAAVVEPKLPKG
ncbi:DUF3558 domain-containing protein [Saccharomonospora halophila]|uniref:DUF3558 domain-containing protein n=1 Tax=Saccharomonospora halophila TaxID=129922 RepID=UPI0018DB69C1|nr:DUF3558 domain-containing protein [Saccharomonospora halophila]